MERLHKRFVPGFSPIYTALAVGIFAGLGLSVLSFVGPHPAKYIWFGYFTLLFAGVILQILSNRVLYVRVYETLGWGLSALALAAMAWGVTVQAWRDKSEMLTAVVIATMFLWYGASKFAEKYHSPQRERMPYGGVGKMNQKTGVIVDPRYTEMSPEAQTRSAKGTQMVIRLTPLIAGMAMLLARSLSANIEVLLLIPVGLYLGAVTTSVAASQASYAVSIARWEREHGKPIYLKRPRPQ